MLKKKHQSRYRDGAVHAKRMSKVTNYDTMVAAANKVLVVFVAMVPVRQRRRRPEMVRLNGRTDERGGCE